MSNKHTAKAVAVRQDRDRKETATLEISSPLPPPDAFAGYEAVLAGSGDRILKMAESEQEHQHAMENKGYGIFIARTIGTITAAVIIACSALFGGIYLLIHDKDIAGYVAMAVPLVGMIRAMIGVRAKRAPPPEE